MKSFQAAFPFSLAPTQWQRLQSVLQPRDVAKGEDVLRPGQLCDRVYFVERGLLRHYVLHDGKEINTHFALAGTFTTDFASLTGQLPTNTYIEALERTELLVLPRADMLALYAQAPELEAAGRALLEKLLGSTSCA